MRLIIFLAGFLCLSNSVLGDRNVTVEDTSSSIVLQGPWSHASFPLDSGGSHAFVYRELSGGSTATATFKFTGTAIYYMAPQWPYAVNTMATLDSESPIIIDMTDPGNTGTVGSGPSAQSQVLWGKDGLANTEHAIVFSMASDGGYVVVDALIYTVPDPSSTPLPSTPSSTSQPSTPVQSTNAVTVPPSSTPTTSVPRSSLNLAVIIGPICGALGLALAVIAFLLCRKRRKPTPQDISQVPITGYLNTPLSSPESGNFPPMESPPHSSMSGGSLFGSEQGQLVYDPMQGNVLLPPGAAAPTVGGMSPASFYLDGLPVEMKEKMDEGPVQEPQVFPLTYEVSGQGGRLEKVA